MNLTDPKALDDFAKQVLDKYGTVDILVNCAGIIPKSEGVGDGAHLLCVAHLDHASNAAEYLTLSMTDYFSVGQALYRKLLCEVSQV